MTDHSDRAHDSFDESRYSCRRCGHVCDELRNPDNWMSGWRIDRTGEIVGAEGRRQAGGTTYVGFVPKPKFRHDCICADGLPWDSDTYTPKDYHEVSLVKRLKDRARKNNGATQTKVVGYGIDDLL